MAWGIIKRFALYSYVDARRAGTGPLRRLMAALVFRAVYGRRGQSAR